MEREATSPQNAGEGVRNSAFLETASAEVGPQPEQDALCGGVL